MVLPLYDDNTDRVRFPFVNYTFIAINVFVFVVLQGMGENNAFTYAFSTVPEEILTGTDLVTSDTPIEHPITKEKFEQPGLRETPLTPYLTLLTSIFMHGSLLHLLGNMLFLWIFGDNVEDRLGHVRYLLFYLVCGLLASLAHVGVVAVTGSAEDMRIPALGASGAISGVLGGYLLLFPHRRVVVLLFRFLTWVPAWVAIGIWFLFQIIEMMGALGQSVGVAYGAHVGGFVAGLALVHAFAIGLPSRGGYAGASRPLNRRTPWRY
jgi:membrane associated rhomboid family serine protease